jgi:hypothetical protein
MKNQFNPLESELESSAQVVRDSGGGNGHIRCLSAVPVDIQVLLAELGEAEEAEQNEKKV